MTSTPAFTLDTGLQPLVLVTKIDTYDPDTTGQSLKQTFHSERLQQLVEVRI